MSIEFVGTQGKAKTIAELKKVPLKVDKWLVKVVNHAGRFAARRMRDLAPGSIDALIQFDKAQALDGPFGIIAVAGVEPDIGLPNKVLRGGFYGNASGGFDDMVDNQQGFGLGSNPQDYPVYVDFGTGIYASGQDGENLGHGPIRSIPGSYMKFITKDGAMVITDEVKGQPPAFFSLQAYQDTTMHLPAIFAQAGHPLR